MGQFWSAVPMKLKISLMTEGRKFEPLLDKRERERERNRES